MPNHIPDADSHEKILDYWLLCYGMLYALFHIFPAFLNFNIRYRFMVADLIDLLTPYVIVFLIMKLYSFLVFSQKGSPRWLMIWLIVGAVTFVEGHGIHLSANAIHRHLTPSDHSPLYILTYFFDERLGHILWDSGNLLMVLGILLASFRLQRESVPTSNLGVLTTGAVCYGFTYFVNSVEGQTVVFKLPAAIGIFVALGFWLRQQSFAFRKFPMATFFFTGVGVALVLFVLWWLWQSGFPQFSDLGWI